jgi:hypothetical protein
MLIVLIPRKRFVVNTDSCACAVYDDLLGDTPGNLNFSSPCYDGPLWADHTLQNFLVHGLYPA